MNLSQQRVVLLNNEAIMSHFVRGDCEGAARCLKRSIGQLRKREADEEVPSSSRSSPARCSKRRRRNASPSSIASFLSMSTRKALLTEEATDAPGNLFLPYTRAFFVTTDDYHSKHNKNDLAPAGPPQDRDSDHVSAVVLYNTALSHHTNALLLQQNETTQDRSITSLKSKRIQLQTALQLYQTSLAFVCLGQTPSQDEEDRQQAPGLSPPSAIPWGLYEMVLALWTNMGHIYSALGLDSEARVCLDNLRDRLNPASPHRWQVSALEPDTYRFFQRIVLCGDLQPATAGHLASAA